MFRVFRQRRIRPSADEFAFIFVATSYDISRKESDISTQPAGTTPPEIRGWNWGAFLLSWVWGIGNGVWIALLCLIPCVFPVMVFILGAKGNEWAWRAKNWSSVEEFKRAQRIWAWVGLGVIASFILFALAIMFSIFFIIKQSDAYQGALGLVRKNPQAIVVLGDPIEGGWYVTGSVNTSGPSGNADLAFPVKGPKGTGTVYVRATKKMGEWQFHAVELKVEKPAVSISIVPSGIRGP